MNWKFSRRRRRIFTRKRGSRHRAVKVIIVGLIVSTVFLYPFVFDSPTTIVSAFESILSMIDA